MSGDILTQLKVFRGPKYPPIFQQIVDQIRVLIAQGKLQEGERLPTIKQVCEYLRINPNTVARSYMELERLGLLEGRRGGGTTVCAARALPARERERKLAEIMARALSEAAEFGLTATELGAHLNRLRRTA